MGNPLIGILADNQGTSVPEGLSIRIEPDMRDKLEMPATEADLSFLLGLETLVDDYSIIFNIA